MMKNFIQDLTGFSEKFILLEQYSGDSFRCELDLIEAANNRNIQKFTSSKIDQFEKRIKSEINPNKYQSITQFLSVTGNFFDANSTFIHEYNLKQSRLDYLRLSSDFTLFNFLVKSIRIIHNSFANKAVEKQPVRKTLLEQFFLKLKEHSILEDLLLEENKVLDTPSKIVNCYYLIYETLTSNG